MYKTKLKIFQDYLTILLNFYLHIRVSLGNISFIKQSKKYND